MAKSALPAETLYIRAALVTLAGVVVVIVVALTGKWVAVQGLAARVRSADDATAGRLVRELATFGETAYPALLAAANSERSAVALAARAEVDKLIDEWQQQAYLHPATFSLDSQALPLAQAIEGQLPGSTASGRRWARSILVALVDLAQQQSFDHRLALVQTCDRAISSLPADDPPLAFESDVDYRLTLAPPNTSPLPEDAFVSEPRSVDLTLPPAELPAEPAQSADVSEQEVPDRNMIVLEAIPLEDKLAAEAAVDQWNDDWVASRLREVRDGPAPRVPAHSASTQRQSEPPASEKVADDGTPTDDQLLTALASGDEPSQRAAAKQLEQRGYGLVTHRDARMATSASMADRLALVNLSLTSPRLEPSAWLWRLAHDPSAEIRAAAMLSIATTNDRQLIAEALELALHDTDPRVAIQAEMLKKRLR
ncbi:hypothetical protein [Aeoliella sp.]|uniref:hypothetical protein n=1 Tax=Aeoliella sp. TaxID=2795800 RepID=UPI003CCC1A72